MKYFKLMSLLLCAMCVSFVSCDELNKDDEEEEGNSSWSQFVNIEMTRCERVGNVLQIDYVITNRQNREIQLDVYTHDGVKDNEGTTYTTVLAFGDNDYYHPSYINIAPKSSVTFHVKALDFNAPTSLKYVNINWSLSVEDNDYVYSKNNVSVADNRVLQNGIQTNDTGLKYTLNYCRLDNDGVLWLNFTLKNQTGKDLNDLYLYFGSAKDSHGTSYGSLGVVWGTDGSWYNSAFLGSLRDGESTECTMIVENFDKSSPYVNMELKFEIGNYIPSDDIVRFITIPIEK